MEYFIQISSERMLLTGFTPSRHIGEKKSPDRTIEVGRAIYTTLTREYDYRAKCNTTRNTVTTSVSLV